MTGEETGQQAWNACRQTASQREVSLSLQPRRTRWGQVRAGPTSQKEQHRERAEEAALGTGASGPSQFRASITFLSSFSQFRSQLVTFLLL